MKYRITYYEPLRWVDEYYTMYAETEAEAREHLKVLLATYPPKYHSSYVKIEKVELIERIELIEKKDL